MLTLKNDLNALELSIYMYTSRRKLIRSDILFRRKELISFLTNNYAATKQAIAIYCNVSEKCINYDLIALDKYITKLPFKDINTIRSEIIRQHLQDRNIYTLKHTPTEDEIADTIKVGKKEVDDIKEQILNLLKERSRISNDLSLNIFGDVEHINRINYKLNCMKKEGIVDSRKIKINNIVKHTNKEFNRTNIVNLWSLKNVENS